MKTIKITSEIRAYTEDEAKNIINEFKAKANEEGYIVSATGYTYKTKKKKGVVVSEAWIVKNVAIYNEIWDEGEGEE
jgi:hypothetical protein